MIALLCLADKILVCLELFLVRECIGIDAGHLVSVLVASPVCTGDGTELKCDRKKFCRIIYVRADAQIHVVIARVINRDFLIFRKVLDELGLEALILEDGKRLFARNLFTGPCFLSLQNLTHLVFDGFEIRLLNRLSLRENEIIIESVFNLGPDRILRVFTVQLENRFRENVRHGVTVNLEKLFLFHFFPFCRHRRQSLAKTAALQFWKNFRSRTSAPRTGILLRNAGKIRNRQLQIKIPGTVNTVPGT